jgi:hypothetical protein
MYPHRIRLRGPWDYEPLARLPADAALQLPPPGRMAVPCRWTDGGLPGFAGRVRFRRRFGFPGQIDTHERVWLTGAGVEASADIAVNGVGLGRQVGDQPFECDVTAFLRPRNELVMDVEGGDEGGIWGEVALEIRCTAFLRGVQVRLVSVGGDRFLEVSGSVVGTADRPQELYAVYRRYNVLYARLVAFPRGQPFQFRSEPLPAAGPTGEDTTEPPAVQIDLVNGAAVWYRISKELPSDPAAGSGT